MGFGFSISPVVASLLASAKNGRSDSIKFTLRGDLGQMGEQETFLRERGFDVGRSNVYPGLFTEEDFQRALQAIWQYRIPGWWHYEAEYVKYGICSGEKFKAALDAIC